ncbi:TIGR01777 family oxidoreductase [Nocardioides sp. cx-169]|uniref:TIGR01777 family oxidoreductase n=1 Tax=Nocardioides sp. cx-169 TaxID=2899080 RepID=UPI001E299029|nr:TIGR01777 family oxidoreductase [Nocardioides sp. cx-169]MCD4535563.1 TIGR01777 family oxidoreductase [Nocardioides sp. cx-169]
MASLSILLAGGSGFLGTHLRQELLRRGHTVTSLVRRQPAGGSESRWDPYAGELDRDLVAAADVVVNLAGSPTAGNPHSQKWARELRESRLTTTRLLAEAVAAAEQPPAYLAGNGISYYGDHGDQVLTEASDSRGHALLTQVTREWQEAADPAVAAGARVCILRTAPVMDRRSAPLKQLLPVFRMGLGARLGRGRQHMAMVSLRDWVGGVVHLAEHADAAGPFNLCCADTPTNAEFTQALARAVHRPAFAFAPAPLLRVAGGRMAPELLGSLNVRPAALEQCGYEVRDRDVDAVLATGLASGT